MITETYICKNDRFIAQSYFPIQDKVTFISFWSENNAKSSFAVGMWKIKKLK